MAPPIGFIKKLTSKLSRSSSNSKSKNTVRKRGKKAVRAEQSENNEKPRTGGKRASSSKKPSKEVAEEKTAAQTPPSPDTVSTEGKKSGGQAAKKSGKPKQKQSSLNVSSDISTSSNLSREGVSATEETSSGMDTCDYDQLNSALYTPTLALSVKNEEQEQATETKERSKENDKERKDRSKENEKEKEQKERPKEKEKEMKDRSKENENEKDKKERPKENDKAKDRSKPKSGKKEKKEKALRPKRVWAGIAAGMKFFESNGKIDKIKDEYQHVKSLTNEKTTAAFDANSERNRDNAPKIYDENRVVLSCPGQDYINASVISVKDFSQKIVVAQLPRMENESCVEDFWQMIYQEQITMVYLLVSEDLIKQASTPLFKFETGEYQYIGKMFINNRRTEPDGDPKKYTIEVLPEGNSDSVMCQVHHHTTWPQRVQPPKTNRIIKMIHEFLTEKKIQSANVCVVSEFGSGRACSFLGSLIAINQLNCGIEPNIGEIMTNIRQQRPGATESFDQYAGIYAVVLDYIARKRGPKLSPINADINDFINELADELPTPSSKQ